MNLVLVEVANLRLYATQARPLTTLAREQPTTACPQSVTLHPPFASGTASWASARALRPRSIWRDMTKSAGTMTRR